MLHFWTLIAAKNFILFILRFDSCCCRSKTVAWHSDNFWRKLCLELKFHPLAQVTFPDPRGSSRSPKQFKKNSIRRGNSGNFIFFNHAVGGYKEKPETKFPEYKTSVVCDHAAVRFAVKRRRSRRVFHDSLPAGLREDCRGAVKGGRLIILSSVLSLGCKQKS